MQSPRPTLSVLTVVDVAAPGDELVLVAASVGLALFHIDQKLVTEYEESIVWILSIRSAASNVEFTSEAQKPLVNSAFRLLSFGELEHADDVS